MDFFEHQRRAHRNTFYLVLLFLLSVVLIVCAVYFAVMVALLFSDEANPLEIGWWNPPLFILITAATSLLVLIGSLAKMISLWRGGEVVAGMLGGLPIPAGTTDLNQRKVLNVVEEMSIASGLSVPPVFLLSEEKGINAFAAGYSPRDAVIGVTQGCIERLSRDEIQGVIAHEFSHILNGDMRTNIRLMGVIHGILMIGLLGEGLFRIVGHSAGSSSRRSGRDSGGGQLVILLMGLSLWTVGSIGVLFGRMIKSAISRQREFLADASAVQYTRNPMGIANALKTIGGFSRGSKLKSVRAEEASHFFFGNGLSVPLMDALATHPPIEERIKRIDPSFQHPSQPSEYVASRSFTSGAEEQGALGMAAGAPLSEATVEETVASVGNPQPHHLGYARHILEGLPQPLVISSRDAYGARALVYALLLADEEPVRTVQLAELKEFVDPVVFRETLGSIPHLGTLGPTQRLALIDLSIPALRHQSKQQFTDFKQNLQRLIAADDRIDLFEFTLQYIVFRHLTPHFEGRVVDRVKYGSLEPLREECGLLLSFLTHAGAGKRGEAAGAFGRGSRELKLKQPTVLVARSECRLMALNEALNRLRQTDTHCKEKVVRACAATVLFDKEVEPQEFVLLRAISDALDCPMPPVWGEIEGG